MSQTRLRSLVVADLHRGAAVAAAGCAGWGLWEYIATLVTARVPIGLGTALSFVVLALGLVALAALALVPAVALAAAAARLICALASPERSRAWPGALAPGGAGPAVVAWLWALAIAAATYAAGSFALTLVFTTRFKAPAVIALVLALAQLALIGLAAGWALVLVRGVRWLGARSAPRLGRLDPLSRLAPALGLVALLGIGGTLALFRAIPNLEPIFPARHLLAGVAFVAGAFLGVWRLDRRGRLLPARRHALTAVAGGCGLCAVLSLFWVGADQDTKSLALTASPPLELVIDAVRRANDFDGDGYGSLLGENDCAPFNAAINPEARDVPDNDVDENCNGSDFSLSSLRAQPAGERLAVPDAYRRPWNVLMLTVDTVRYDHTGFGGYAERTGRDTTPNLDRLVRRSVSFEFANAPSAGTMASVPAILTSKFFHSGIALSGERRPKPPKVLDDNVLISEIVKRKGYRTGAILSHEYFNDWGLDQGVDSYDNELGAKRDPFKVTSHDLTDKALAWISANAASPWFLWVHYIDPHGRYVAHPGETSFGTSEEDLYDGELAYTDKHLGRLFEELWRMPGGDRTIIVITSDHGDGFGEHGHINHGFTLYREVLHVPLIFYIPDIEPRSVPGAVTPLDVVPTVADLLDVDVSDLSFEGQSLVPQLFYGRDDLDRVVFAETNAPAPQRAAISAAYKLIYKLRSNVYELYELAADPWEKKNVWRKDKPGSDAMKAAMDGWLERVFYTRDAKTNQAQAKRAWHIVSAVPDAAVPVEGLRLDDGGIQVVGYELSDAAPAPGAKLELIVYLRVIDTPSADFKLQGALWTDAPNASPRSPVRGAARLTADGTLPSSRWRAGELIRDRLPLRVPATWTQGPLGLGLSLLASGGKARVDGPAYARDAKLARLGEIALAAPANDAQPAGPPVPRVAPSLLKKGGTKLRYTAGTGQAAARPMTQSASAPSARTATSRRISCCNVPKLSLAPRLAHSAPRWSSPPKNSSRRRATDSCHAVLASSRAGVTLGP